MAVVVDSHLSPEQVDVLRSLLGQRIASLSASEFSVEGVFVRAPSLTFGSKPPVTVSMQWSETPQGVDSFLIALSQTPELRPCTIRLKDISPLVQIQIIEYTDEVIDGAENDRDRVTYDADLVVTHADGSEFLVGAYRSVMSWVEFTRDSEILAGRRAEGRIREALRVA